MAIGQVRFQPRDFGEAGVLGAVGAVAGAAVAWGVLHVAVLPAAALTGVSVFVSRITKPIFDAVFGTKNDASGIAGRALHLAVSIGAGVLAAAGVAALVGVAATTLPAALIITIATIGALALLGYVVGYTFPTVVEPELGGAPAGAPPAPAPVPGALDPAAI